MTNGMTPEAPLSILLVEQDINWGRFLQSYLEHKGYHVSLSTDGWDAWQRIVKGQHNFCILNPDLPSMDGCALAEHIREQVSNIPVVFMASSRQDSETMRIDCFKAGADDVIVRPCSMEEIVLRIKTIEKRFRFRPLETHRVFDLGKLRFDPDRQVLCNQNCNIRLTTKESELLLALCLSRGKVLERDQALLAVWKSTEIYNVRSMDVYISKLRRLLFQYTYSEILNIHGVGFKLITHRDAGFRQILRRDAGMLRKRMPAKKGNGADYRLEAVAVGTSETVLEAMAEEEVPMMREPEAKSGYARPVAVGTEALRIGAGFSERDPVKTVVEGTSVAQCRPAATASSACRVEKSGDRAAAVIASRSDEAAVAAEQPQVGGAAADSVVAGGGGVASSVPSSVSASPSSLSAPSV